VSLETVFRIANFGAVIGWVVLICAALFGWERGRDRVAGTIVPLLLAAAYVVVLGSHWGSAQGDFSSLAGVQTLFRQPAAVLAGWMHYLAFDMLVGVFLARRMMEEGVPRVLRLAVLPLTFFFGPAGFLLYHAIHLARGGIEAKPARRTRKRPAPPRPEAPNPGS
jgi:uncharacterized membrane protein YkvI